jgi:hypothetical protein
LLRDGLLKQDADMTHPHRQPDIEVMFELTSLRVEGDQKVVLSGYRPIYEIHADYWTSAHHEFIGVEQVVTGEHALAKVWLLSPEAYPHSLWIGRTLRVAEGSRIIGVAEVLSIINPDFHVADLSHSS